MTRSKLLLAWGALLLGLSACDKTTSSSGGDAKPSNLTVNFSSTELTAGGTAVDVSVSASSDTGIVSILPTIKNSSGSAVTGSFIPQFTAMPKVGDKAFVTSGWKISALSTASAGSYTLTVTLTDMTGAMTTKDVAFTVKAKTGTVDTTDPGPVVGEPMNKLGSVLAGAQSSSNGSFFELGGTHAGYLYTSKADFSSKVIDVVFGVDGSSLSFMSPRYASTHGFDLSSWSILNLSAIVDMGTTQPTNSGVIDQALTARGAESATVIAKHYYGVGCTSGDIVMLYVTGLTGSGKFTDANVDIYVAGDPKTVIDSVDPGAQNKWQKVELGAQSATPGSFLDIDGKTVFTAGQKTATEIASIDLVFVASTSGLPMLYSPAKVAGTGLVSIGSWGVKNETYIVDLGVTEPTKESDIMHATGSSDAQSIVIEVGHYYAVETENGPFCALKVESIAGTGRSAVATVSMKTF